MPLCQGLYISQSWIVLSGVILMCISQDGTEFLRFSLTTVEGLDTVHVMDSTRHGLSICHNPSNSTGIILM